MAEAKKWCWVLTLFAQLESGFRVGLGFSSVFSKRLLSKFFRVQILPSKDLYLSKKRGANEMYQSSQKNENTMFSSGNINAKSGFVTEKHNLFFPNSSFSNNDNGLGAKAYIGNCQSGVGCKV